MSSVKVAAVGDVHIDEDVLGRYRPALEQIGAKADVLLMNTCSVRENAEDKVYSLLGEWRALKKANPHVLIGVGGCVASQEGAGLVARAPYVDLVFGPQTLHRLPEMIGELKRTAEEDAEEDGDVVRVVHTAAGVERVSDGRPGEQLDVGVHGTVSIGVDGLVEGEGDVGDDRWQVTEAVAG